jgi:hypothetical protein
MGMTKPPVDIEIIAKAVELACRAPSLHNSQPWRWTASDTVVELHADAHRVVRSHDSSGREALISCGVALDHFRTAMAAAGWNTTVEQFPNPDKLDHVASITFARLKSVPQDVRDRADGYCIGAPIGFRSAHPTTGSRSNRCFAISPTAIWRRSTS